MRVGAATADWAINAPWTDDGAPTLGGSGWYRIGQPLRLLRREGDEIEVGRLAQTQEGLLAVSPWQEDRDPLVPEVILLQRWMLDDVQHAIGVAVANGQVVVQDVDDDFWSLHPRNRASRVTDPQANPRVNRRHYLAGLRASSLVVASTPYLAARLREEGVERVTVIRNGVDLDAFGDPRAHRDRRSVYVGWAGATPWRSGDLEVLRPVVRALENRNPSLRWLHAGHLDNAPTFSDLTGADPDRTMTQPMVPTTMIPSLYDLMDVGLVPLSDHPFNASKSWIKGLEYVAAGVPFVAPPNPEYAHLRTLGIGQTAKQTRGWISHIARLVASPAERAAEADHNLAALREHGLTAQAQAGELRQVLSALSPRW